ncbi:hypothetical protein H2198_009455 [Neophaeococcomyces mojaviensis]|uniref:Uncharacterized protein n=1 Tax=Neophaeococcomyces mojaviensis TaxID=3383035 RepID=A0ACC2ZUD5_9EURO|nr:hypothetical protein H2198_009455 [Knufia sp. JES_112]
MSSKSAVANLNQMASGTRTSPRKRPRATDDQESPNKKRAVDFEVQPGSRAGRSRKSTTQLPLSRASTAADHPPQSNEITFHPPVPLSNTINGEPETKQKKRKLGAKDKANKSSPFKGKGIVGRVSVAGVNFNSSDSPAKINRRRGKANGVRVISTNFPTNPLDILNAHPIQVTELARQNATNKAQTTTRLGSARKLASLGPDRNSDTTEAVRISEHQGRDMESQTEESSESDAGEEEQDRASAEEIPASAADKERDGDDMREEDAELEPSADRESAAPGPQRRRKGRTPRTQEEVQQREQKRKAQKEAEERRRKEDMEEASKAQQEEFDKFKEKFGRGLGRAAEEVGGTDTWKVMGAGALTIRDMAPRKREMDTSRAQSIWRKLLFLDEAFQLLEDNGEYSLQNEEAARTALRDLEARSTLDILHPKRDQQQRGDPTVVELYQQIIPKLVFLLKKVLLGRYVDGLSAVGSREILTLTEAGMQLCKIAMEWEPKPSALSSGTRRAVHNHINPNLRIIRNCITERIQFEEHVSEQQQRVKKLAQDQRESRERKLKLWAERQQRFASNHAVSHSHHAERRTKESDVVDIDDIEEVRPTQRLQGEERPRAHRQATEEIPAPDPTTQWTREEDEALLDGLQEHPDGDRFGQILDTCPQLSDKDIFQLMARAQFHKQNNIKAIVAAEKRGDSCFDWLSSV